MKKILVVLFAFLLVISLCSCSKKSTEDIGATSENNSQNSEVLEAPEEKTEQESEKEEEAVVDENLSPTPEVEEKKEETPKTATIDPYGYLGKSESSFIDSLKNLGFTNVVKIDSIYSNYPEGTICYYLPDGEQTLDKTIEYKVSIGAKPVEEKQETTPTKRTIISDVVERKYEDGSWYAVRTTKYSDGGSKEYKQIAGFFVVMDTEGNQQEIPEPTEEQWQEAERSCWNAY